MSFIRTITNSRALLRPIFTIPKPYAYGKFNVRTMATANQTFTEAIKQDHAELKDYYGTITAPGASRETQKEYQNLFVWELARHSIGEEIVIYPAMEKHMGHKGKAMADKDRAEHAEVKKLLYDWQSLNPTDGRFMPLLKELWSSLEKHIEEEERDDLPALEKAVGARDECQKLGRSFTRTKKFAPTRSHPSAPDKPPFETAAGLLTAPIDKLMDAFRKFPDDA